jgi:hypothetical protein
MKTTKSKHPARCSLTPYSACEELRRKVEHWKQVVRDVGHALGTQNAEQFEDPEIAKSMLLRQIKWNREDSLQNV